MCPKPLFWCMRNDDGSCVNIQVESKEYSLIFRVSNSMIALGKGGEIGIQPRQEREEKQRKPAVLSLP